MSIAAKQFFNDEAPVLGEMEFQRIAAILYDESGIFLPQTKMAMVFARLSKRLRILQIGSFRDYCDLVGSEEGAEERQNMLQALTTNVTKFMREPHHFKNLQNELSERLLPRLRKGETIRIWSAGCSSGQEPYSIALTIIESIPQMFWPNVKILATDIDANMVAVGVEGVYGREDLAGLDIDIRGRWFHTVDQTTWTCADALKKFVTFRILNLNGDWPLKAKFNAIFCRNVAIYFDDQTQSRLWKRFQNQLTDEGLLYIGHSERLSGPSRLAFESNGVTIYRLRSGDRK